MRLGIDFGTTNSSISCYDGQQLTVIPADPDNENPYILPSLLYIDREHKSVEGIKAAQEYLRRETGRLVQWEKRIVGTVEMEFSDTDYRQDTYAWTDVAANGRLLQSIKTALRLPAYDGTRIFDKFYTADRLILRLLRNLKQRAETTFDQECDSIILGRPVKFSDEAHLDRRAEEILYKAARAAGFTEISFVFEPLGVAYLQHISASKRHTALVFDFGGGTLDLTVAEIGGQSEPNILATQGVLLGGDDIDRRIMRHLTKYLGKDAKVGRERVPFPFDMLEQLEAWQTMIDLSQSNYLGRIKEFQRHSTDPRAMRALEHLVTRNLGYKLFREIERCKIELSSQPSTTLEFRAGPINIREVITREVFNRLIADDLLAAQTGIREVLEKAGTKAGQIDAVLRTGGSSNIPVFRDLLTGIFDAEKLQDLDPLVSVVGGMAVIAQRDHRQPPVYAIRYSDYAPVVNVRAKSNHPYPLYRLGIDEKCYSDADFVISRCPVTLAGLPAIRTSTRSDIDADADDFLQFDLTRPARVYVGYDPMATIKPHWLSEFKPLDMRVEVAEEWHGERILPLYYKEFPAGTVTLGGNKARGFQSGAPILGYIVIVQMEI